jgi:hypothetical protein
MRSVFSVLLGIAAMTATAAAHPPLSLPASAPVQRDFTNEHASTRIDLPSADTFIYRHLRAENHAEDSAGLTLDNPHALAPSEGRSGPALDIGAFHAEIGGTGTHAHLAHYTLEGVSVMGGQVSGSIDGKSARIAIDW